jgi:FMN phosphatase YigB (HAD superfamily)
VHAVVTSAAVGVEKPHPLIFRTALDAAGTPTHAWMIGDNPVADVAGAAKLGIPGVLVRVPAFSADYIERINCSYGHGDWIGWQELCELRASDALQAVELILGYGDVR